MVSEQRYLTCKVVKSHNLTGIAEFFYISLLESKKIFISIKVGACATRLSMLEKHRLSKPFLPYLGTPQIKGEMSYVLYILKKDE